MIEEYLLGSSYCTWKNIIPGVSQGSILWHLLFNMFLCDLCDISYADDTTPYVASKITTEVLENLTNITYKLFTWFANNQMKVNHWKCPLLLSTQEDANMQIANATVNSSSSNKLLGLVFDSKLKFKKHIENIRQKAIKLMDSLNVVYLSFIMIKGQVWSNFSIKIILFQYTTITMIHGLMKCTKCQVSEDNDWYFSGKGLDTFLSETY